MKVLVLSLSEPLSVHAICGKYLLLVCFWNDKPNVGNLNKAGASTSAVGVTFVVQGVIFMVTTPVFGLVKSSQLSKYTLRRNTFKIVTIVALKHFYSSVGVASGAHF